MLAPESRQCERELTHEFSLAHTGILNSGCHGKAIEPGRSHLLAFCSCFLKCSHTLFTICSAPTCLNCFTCFLPHSSPLSCTHPPPCCKYTWLSCGRAGLLHTSFCVSVHSFQSHLTYLPRGVRKDPREHDSFFSLRAVS